LHGARRAIRLNLVRLRDVGVPVVATVVVNRTNESWIRATVAELESERIPYLVSSIILPNVGKVRSPLETNDYLSSTAVLSDLLKHGITHRRRRECAAARTKAWVASNGDVFACELAKSLPIGNVLKTDFLKVWGSETAEEMRSHYGLEPDRCRTCSSRPRCPHCPALAELERGRPDAVYSVFCETTTFIERQHTQSPGDGLENGNSKPVGRKSAIQS
jgi:radical SAM protein with 4Fe4S-binding SPASM domain